MKKLVVLAVAAGVAAGCGTHTSASQLESSITPAQKAKAEQIAKTCHARGGGLKAEIRCAVPPGHGFAFARCVFDAAPHSEVAAEKALIVCGERYR